MLFAWLAAWLAVAPAQVRFTTSTSVQTARPGQRLALFVDVTPRPKMHVYAPGAKDYLPIALVINSPGVRAGKLTYPPPQELYFEPTKEHVPVYDKPFRLTQIVVVDARVTPGTLIVTGVLKYQACDDSICYNPVDAPVSWPVNVK